MVARYRRLARWCAAAVVVAAVGAGVGAAALGSRGHPGAGGGPGAGRPVDARSACPAGPAVAVRGTGPAGRRRGPGLGCVAGRGSGHPGRDGDLDRHGGGVGRADADDHGPGDRYARLPDARPAHGRADARPTPAGPVLPDRDRARPGHLPGRGTAAAPGRPHLARARTASWCGGHPDPGRGHQPRRVPLLLRAVQRAHGPAHGAVHAGTGPAGRRRPGHPRATRPAPADRAGRARPAGVATRHAAQPSAAGADPSGGGRQHLPVQPVRAVLHPAAGHADALPPRAPGHADPLRRRRVPVLLGAHRRRPGPPPGTARGAAPGAFHRDGRARHLRGGHHAGPRRLHRHLVHRRAPALGRLPGGRPVHRWRHRLGVRRDPRRRSCSASSSCSGSATTNANNAASTARPTGPKPKAGKTTPSPRTTRSSPPPTNRPAADAQFRR